MSVNTSLIYGCLSSASTVIRWLRGLFTNYKSPLYTFYSRNPTCGIHPCLWISNRKYPPCPQNSIIMNPPLPFGNPKSRLWYDMDIFWNRPMQDLSWANMVQFGLTRADGSHKCGQRLESTDRGQQKLMHAARCWKKVTGADKYMYWKS